MDNDPLAKKSLGQHWLNDPDILMAICSMAEITNHDLVLEVGPGTGSLTRLLLEKASRVVAVEFDESLISGLKQKFTKDERLQLINEDIRRFDLTKLPHSYKVVANIPYYLTSYLVRLLSQSSNPPVLAVILIQQEVAQRLAAKPGGMSLLSVMAQSYWEVELGMIVRPESFTPPPKVNSQVVKLTRKAQPLVAKNIERQFFQTVKIGFSQKRKTLANSLSAGLHISKDEAKHLIELADIDVGVRPQELIIEHWLNLTRVVAEHKH